MAVIYRTAGAWGPGKGSNLTPVEVDSNFWDLVSRLAGLEQAEKAVNTLTLAGNAIADETVGIGSRTYTWKAVPAAADEVKIGASASVSLDNLIAAINKAGGEGTLYGTGTAVNGAVSAVAGTGDTMDIEARVAGEAGNTIATSETMTNGSWATPTLTGGIGIGADNIENIIVTGSQMTIVLTSGATFGPFTLPIASLKWRGNWTAAMSLFKNDIIVVPLDGVYLVRVDHVTGTSFNASLTISGAAVYQKILSLPGFPTMNFKGEWAPDTEYVLHDVFYVNSVGLFTTLVDHTSTDPFDPDAVDVDDNPLYIQLVDWSEGTSGGEFTIEYKEAVQLATADNIALTGEQTIDGVLTSSSRVLVWRQVDKTQNGIYVSAAGAWARAADADEDSEVETGMAVIVEEGTVRFGRSYVLTTPNPIELGVTELSFVQLRVPTRPRQIRTFTDATVIPDKTFRNIIARFDSASAQTIDLGTGGFGLGYGIILERVGAGTVTIVPDVGITIESEAGLPLELVRYRQYELIKVAADKWLLVSIPNSDGIENASIVAGASVSDALDTLAAAIGGGGAINFTDLADVPASYTGHANKAVVVKADESGLEFTSTSGSFVLKAGDTMTGALILPAGTAALPSLGVGEVGTGLSRPAAGSLDISTGGVWRARFTAVGLAIGPVSGAAFDPTELLMIRNTGAARLTLQGEAGTNNTVERYSSDATGPNFVMNKYRGSIASPAVIQQNAQLGTLFWQAYDGSAIRTAAHWRAIVVAATPSPTDMETRVLLTVVPAGSGTATELARYEHATGFSMYGANIVIDADRIVRQRSYTVGTLPAPGTAGRGPVWVTDLSPQAGQMIDNGSAWVRVRPLQSFVVACSDETTSPLVAGTAKVTFRMPYAFKIKEVRASLTTAQTSGTILTIDINEAGASILSTKLTIDNNEKTSVTAATPAVLSDTDLADDAEITIDFDAVGVGGAGAKVTIIGVPTA